MFALQNAKRLAKNNTLDVTTGQLTGTAFTDTGKKHGTITNRQGKWQLLFYRFLDEFCLRLMKSLEQTEVKWKGQWSGWEEITKGKGGCTKKSFPSQSGYLSEGNARQKASDVNHAI